MLAPHIKHSVIKPSWLMLCRAEFYTKHTNTLCGQNVYFLHAFEKLRKVTIGFVMSHCLSVHLSARNDSITTEGF